jgi:hypothetical protein
MFTTLSSKNIINSSIVLLLMFAYIFPLMYDFLSLMPYRSKWISDVIFLVMTIFLFTYKQRNILMLFRIRHFRIFSIMILMLLISHYLSYFFNGSSTIMFVLEIRKYLYFFILMVLLLLSAQTSYESKTEILFSKIINIQIFIIPLQYIAFIAIDYSGILVDQVPYNYLDIASGTFGAGKTGVVSVFLVLYYFYKQVYDKKIRNILILIPLVFTFSGGGNVLLLLAVISVVLYTDRKRAASIFKYTVSIIALLVLIQLIGNYVWKTDYIGKNVDYALKKVQLILFEKNEMHGSDLSRLGGIKYLSRHTEYPIFGNGPGLFKSSRTLNIEAVSFQSLGDVRKSGFTSLFIDSGYFGLIVLFSYIGYIVIKCYLHSSQEIRRISGVLLLFGISTFYIPNLYNDSIMYFIIFVLSQYIQHETLFSNRRLSNA